MEGKKKKKGEPGREREALMCKVEEETEEKTALGPPKESGAGGGGGGGMMGNLGLPDFKGEISEMLSGLLELNRECFPNEN